MNYSVTELPIVMFPRVFLIPSVHVSPKSQPT